ncbi:MAG TPA: nuclear transport factor 2 family protein [Candidatus Dormibacteraeota bacterium]|nr:nuclear transport factor 2 family protein [Candidatus Dormibacteraeota bacterium]
MIRTAVRTLVRRSFSSIERGDVDKAMAPFAEDFRFTFPGRHSFAAQGVGKREFKAWLTRLAHLQPKFRVSDVFVKGPPWNQRIAFRLSDEIRAPDGFVYRNELVEYAHARWGRIRSLEVFLDTQAVAELDAHLTSAGEAPPAA